MTSYHGGKQRIGLEIAENIHIMSTILEGHGNINIKGYCDPPYSNTISRYYTNRSDNKLNFNTDEFWNWCRLMSEHNVIFVSGYSAPRDFRSIMSSSHKLTGISPGKNNKKRVEKLFVKV